MASDTPAMTADAARAVAEIALSADGNCRFCARRLLDQLSSKFPDHAAVFEAAYTNAHPDSDPREDAWAVTGFTQQGSRRADATSAP